MRIDKNQDGNIYDYYVNANLINSEFCDAKNNFKGALPQAKESINAPPSGLIDIDSFLRISSYKQLKEPAVVPIVHNDGSCFKPSAGKSIDRNNSNERNLRAEGKSKTFPVINTTRAMSEYVNFAMDTKQMQADDIERMYRQKR